MKISLIANISINGKVLVSDNPLYKLPKEAFTFYLDIAHQIGNLVIGYNTFQNFQNSPQEVIDLFKGIEIIVLSTNQSHVVKGYTFISSPEEAIAYMTTKGITELAIGGGTGTFNAFIDKELVTDLYININPLFIGGSDILGIRNNISTKFDIVTHKEYNGSIKLHLTKSRD
ncbi:dihydrofolate reductase family protein [Myroides marinus]|uniref:Bacterial bifunctional deaminase-reductase C-terminal domain-containing protein n=1 Tax=Myroides marinus TaxID=703342 RepID=A0A163XTY7_9FLAO|nr:dihydrofolate reductase [Myroides marinus]KZE78436.1 hypothetical protein AV926_12120 [Myroides marinus]MDM1348191.1 dihydrofolate reductase [Myroides marinus]MDM1380292.1 dihydrofolate reductase [Myroides marinus]MDM1387578.1 dihydrofolate reductase [Myroides marinus]MDM1394776.1 dihydrofolate reductase [Myroides marinus]